MTENKQSLCYSLPEEKDISSEAQAASVIAALIKTLSENEPDLHRRFEENRACLTEEELALCIEVLRYFKNLPVSSQQAFEDAKKGLEAIRRNRPD